MALNSTHFFDVDPISPKSNRVAHPDSGILGETLNVGNIIHWRQYYGDCEHGNPNSGEGELIPQIP